MYNLTGCMCIIEEGVLPEWLSEALLECTKLRDFNNHNVLRMIGIVIDANNVYVLYPEMEKRTLKQFLVTCRKTVR